MIVLNRRKLVFQKIKDVDILSYEIYGQKNGETYLLADKEPEMIETPVLVIDKITKEKLLPRTKRYHSYKVPFRDILTDLNKNTLIRVNGDVLDIEMSCYSKENNTIDIYVEISPLDDVEVLYYIDGIAVELNNSYDKYIVIPVYSKLNSAIGEHHTL